MRNVINIDYQINDHGFFSQSCQINSLIIKIKPLKTQINNLQMVFGNNVSDILTLENEIIQWDIPIEYFIESQGLVEIKVLSSEGESPSVDLLINQTLKETDNIYCKYDGTQYLMDKVKEAISVDDINEVVQEIALIKEDIKELNETDNSIKKDITTTNKNVTNLGKDVDNIENIMNGNVGTGAVTKLHINAKNTVFEDDLKSMILVFG